MRSATASPPRPSLLALEDAEDYQAFEAAVIADYDAETAVERELVLRLASVLWRLRRATGIETALFESVTAEPGKLEHWSSRPTLVEAANLSDQNQLHLVATRQSDAAAANELSFDTKRDIADCFLRLAAQPTFALDRLSRYEHLLWRQARQIVFTLGIVATPQTTAEPHQAFHSRSGDASPVPCPKSSVTTCEINAECADRLRQFQRPQELLAQVVSPFIM